MATLTHHHEPVVAEHLQEHPGLQRTFVTIIIAGVIVLALGLLAAFMGWGAHHEAAGHAAAKECRMPDLPPGAQVRVPPECQGLVKQHNENDRVRAAPSATSARNHRRPNTHIAATTPALSAAKNTACRIGRSPINPWVNRK